MTSILTLLALSGTTQATEMVLDATYDLGPEQEFASGNFYPQGLGVDEDAEELLYAQSYYQYLSRTDLTGNPVGKIAAPQNHITAVAASATHYYFTDYTGNSGGMDLYQVSKSDGAMRVVGADKLGYGGYPIDVRGTTLYRTETSTSYSWSNLDQLRISDLSSPDTITTTLTLATPRGIGDIGVDLDRGVLWVLEYQASANILELDLSTGALLATHTLGIDGLHAGLTYYKDKVYYYDWNNGASTLTVWNVDNDVDDDTVPNAEDNCPEVPNTDQADEDGDGLGDLCDICPHDNPDDTDGDGVCDTDDACEGFPDALDDDGDGTPDACDLCPGERDSDDADGDGTPDACDTCPDDALDDSDGDGSCDSDDLCPGFNDAFDYDRDGIPDACDACPVDATNDSDADGACDGADRCPGFDDALDADGDDIPDGCDVCPDGDDRQDFDGDGRANACDPCPLDATNDSDADGACDGVDRCPGFDDALDADGDTIPDGCDLCPAGDDRQDLDG
ncbi:MAG: hypothetical protein JXX28_13910, partial [Deltaproteobacteria bacterium]|nr:hypothetical protein [Deltaproteobacteria bacterium]